MTPITRILVPTDFSATSDVALTYAKRLAEQFGASIHLLHAFEDPYTTAAFASAAYSSVPVALGQELLCRAEAELAERLTEAERARFHATTQILSGPPTAAIVRYASDIGADLIVMGTHGRSGVAHLTLGSVAERVVRGAACPVLTLRESANRALRRILVPTDFSETADAALEYAFVLADRFGAAVQLLHVLEDPFTGSAADEPYIPETPGVRTAMLRDAQARLDHRIVSGHPNVTVQSEVLFGHKAKSIADYAAIREVDLIVMGTHGRTGVAHLLLGSVAETLVRTSPCPVFTVRAAPKQKLVTELVYDVAHLPA